MKRMKRIKQNLTRRSRMAVARGRTSLWVSSDIGAIAGAMTAHTIFGEDRRDVSVESGRGFGAP
jgi:hypothetical protein